MRIWFFLAMCILGGTGGLAGSAAGAALGGKAALFTGGFLGGVLIAPLSAKVVLWCRWITPDQYWPTTVGAALGFVAAAAAAVASLWTPLGPIGAILSTTLTGVGALMGQRWRD